MDSPSEGVFPDLPQVPALPNLRRQNSTPAQIISQMESVLRSARDAVHQVECCAKRGQQLAQIRAAVVDLRRVTFVLQTLRGRVDGFDDWYGEVQESLRSDPLMRYFVELRNEIEKRGLPGVVAELYSLETGEPVADVACYEDEHGLAADQPARCPFRGGPRREHDRRQAHSPGLGPCSWAERSSRPACRPPTRPLRPTRAPNGSTGRVASATSAARPGSRSSTAGCAARRRPHGSGGLRGAHRRGTSGLKPRGRRG